LKNLLAFYVIITCIDIN